MHAAESDTSGGVARGINVRYHLNHQLKLLNNHHQLYYALLYNLRLLLQQNYIHHQAENEPHVSHM